MLTLNSVLTAATYPVLGDKPAATLGPVTAGIGNAGALNLQVYNASVYVQLYIPDDPDYNLRGYHPTNEILMAATATQSQIRSWQGVAGFVARDAVAGLHGTLIADLTEPADPVSTVGVPIGSGGNQIGGGLISGTVDSAGNIVTGSGFTVTKGAAGIYVLNFPAGTFSSVPSLVANPQTTGLIPNTEAPRSTTQKGVKIVDAASTPTDSAFEFIVAAAT